MVLRPLFLAAFFFLFLVETALAAPLTRGDYDNDGKSDLAVAEVTRTGSGSTAYLARGSNLGQIFFTFNRAADALAPGRFFSNWGTVPAIVTVTSTSQPLLWTVRAPSGQDATVLYGLPGDTITNLIDWDGDKLDDFLVVRAGAKNEFGDGNTYLHWYSAYSKFGGTIVERVFGLSGDRVFTFFDGNTPQYGAVRLATSGACAGQFEWFSLVGGTSSNLGPIQCWGLSGDIPLVRADINNNGKADWIVVRPETNGTQNAYVLFDNLTTAIIPLGLSTAVPQIGNYYGTGQTFAWSQRDAGLVGVRPPSGPDQIISFGIPSNVVIRSDGTVVQPTSTDQLPASTTGGGGGGGGGGGEVASCGTTKNSGYLYKPSSQDSGGTREGFPMVLLNGSGSASCGDILATDGTVISKFGKFNSNRYYEGYGCGNASRQSASGLAAQAEAVTGNPGGYIKIDSTCYGPVSSFRSRFDRR